MSIKALQSSTSFLRYYYVLVGALAAACLLLTWLTFLQGARVRSAVFDSTKLTVYANQQLVLQLNQGVGAITAKQIEITPQASFETTSNGKVVGIQFNHPLRNNTSYRVHIKGQRAADYTFTTGSASMYYSVPGANGQSTMYKRQLSSGEQVAIVQDKLIDDYIVLGDAVVYTTKEIGGSSKVYLYNGSTSEIKEIQLPGQGMVRAVRGAADGHAFGFVYNDGDFESSQDNTLFIYDISTAKTTQVLGFENKPLKVLDWQFARNSRTIAALGADTSLALVNAGKTPVPLGQYGAIEGFAFDDSGVYVNGLEAGRQLINLTSLARTTSPGPTGDQLLFAAIPLNTEAGSLLRAVSYGNAGASIQFLIEKPSGQKLVYTAADSDGYVSALALSSNDQYVAVTFRDSNTQKTMIKIIDIATGKVIDTIQGEKFRWPAS
jgi:hypothetical protein